MTPVMTIAEASRNISDSRSDKIIEARIAPETGCRNWNRPMRAIPPVPSAQYQRT